MNDTLAFRSRCRLVPTATAAVLSLCVLAVFAVRTQAQYAAMPDSSCSGPIDAYRASATPTTRAAMIACTDSVDSAARDTRLGRTNAEALRLAQTFLDIPEYHDEGRLPAGLDLSGRPALGPLAGIYAQPFLHGFTRPAQIYEQGERGTLAGIVVVEQQKGETMPNTYTALGLAFGLNCVWLYVDPPPHPMEKGTNEYAAYLRHLAYHAWVSHGVGAPPKCDRSATMSAVLPVTAVANPQYAADSVYLPVARFDIDRHGNLVLGLRCLAAFCEIGVASVADLRPPNNGHAYAPLANISPSAPPVEKYVVRHAVKAWHDEQELAIRDDAYYWRPSGIHAIVFPDTSASVLDSADFTNRWRPVAHIYIDGPVPERSKYYGWGLRGGWNIIDFQFTDSAGTKKWRARLRRPTTTKGPPWVTQEWMIMERTLHHDVSVPPVVRFRWTGVDDGVWGPCGNACCRAANAY